MASITARKLTSGAIRWRVQFRIGQLKAEERFTSEKAAREFGNLVDRLGGDTARKVLTARTNAKEILTFRTWTERYLDATSGLLTGVTDRTREDYVRIARRSFAETLDEYPVSVIDRPILGQWLAWQQQQPSVRDADQPVSAKTIKNYHALLSQILESAADNGHTDRNHAKGMRLPTGLKRDGIFLTNEELTTIMATLRDGYVPFVDFLVGTGARFSEATALTWGDISDGPTTAVSINKAWKRSEKRGWYPGPPKTKKANRTIVIHKALRDAMGERGKTDELVFKNIVSGEPLRHNAFYKQAWSRMLDTASDVDECARLRVKPIERRPRVHDLRHTHASMLLDQGASLQLIQYRLGHESLTTTADTYGHRQTDVHQAMAGLVENALSGVQRTARAIAP